MATRSRLSAGAGAVLEMIAAGKSYEQILEDRPGLTYFDIFRAAREAIDVAGAVAEKRERHPRAYEDWTEEEDERLRGLVRTGQTVARIAGRLLRERGEVRGRILKLNLVGELTGKERERRSNGQ